MVMEYKMRHKFQTVKMYSEFHAASEIVSETMGVQQMIPNISIG